MDDLSDDLKNELKGELADKFTSQLGDESSADDAILIPGDGSDDKKSKQPETLSDDMFSIKISQDMNIRNALRSGLVEAQGKDTDKMPMFVSWPGWLDDGIVCMFARDFREVLDRTVKDAAVSFGGTFNSDRQAPSSKDTPEAKAEDAEFEPMSFPELDQDS